MDAVIRVENLTHTYSVGTPFEKTAINNINVDFRPGELVAVIGHTGSGKSTFMQHMNGLLAPTSGHVYCEGQDIFATKEATRDVRFKVGLVFQNPRFQFLTLTVENEVLATLRAAYPSAPGKELESRVDALLEEFGLLPWKKKSPYELSQGQQRRLALLSMLAGDRPLLLLDEPTYAQDQRSTRFILDLLERKVRQGLTVVMATHDLALAKAWANQILLLENGVLTPVIPQRLDAYWTERGEGV